MTLHARVAATQRRQAITHLEELGYPIPDDVAEAISRVDRIESTPPAYRDEAPTPNVDDVAQAIYDGAPYERPTRPANDVEQAAHEHAQARAASELRTACMRLGTAVAPTLRDEIATPTISTLRGLLNTSTPDTHQVHHHLGRLIKAAHVRRHLTDANWDHWSAWFTGPGQPTPHNPDDWLELLNNGVLLRFALADDVNTAIKNENDERARQWREGEKQAAKVRSIAGSLGAWI